MNKKHLHTRPTHIRSVLRLCIAILCICAVLTTISTVNIQSRSSETVRQYADVFISKLSNELGNNIAYMEDSLRTASYRNMYYQGDMYWIEQSGNLQKTYALLNQRSINRYNFFVYNTELNSFLELTAVKLPFTEYRPLRNEIKTMARENVFTSNYHRYEMENGRVILLTMRAVGEFVVGSWITEEEFLAGLSHIGGNNLAQFSLWDREETGTSLDASFQTYQLEKSTADFYIRMRVKPNQSYTWVLIFQILQMCLLMVGMVTIWMSISAVHRYFLNPIQNLTETLRKYEKNTLSYDRVSPDISDTLDDAETVLSQLGEKLETLSIRLYETELEKRQLNINFRNLQIRPHFLVNNLATIHDMAQLGESEKIMNLTVVLSHYYRYVLRDCMEMVPLWQELRHMENIIKVHQEWNGNGIQLSLQVAEQVKNTRIPVLLVSTFLENSLKHAANSFGGLNICVEGKEVWIDHQAYLFLQIRDDGNGFPQELVENLERGKPVPETEGRHIGINNAIQRIRLIYGTRAKIVLSNYSQGAQVQIWIPVGGETNEAADCR